MIPNDTSILTYRTGTYFDFADPKPEMIHIEDIAYGLSEMRRYNAQTRKPYTVGQHSIHASTKLPLELQIYGLMHDAAEAYTGDCVQPLKRLLPQFKVIEERVERVVCERFGLDYEIMRSLPIREVDYRVFSTEKGELTKSPNWALMDEYPPYDDIHMVRADLTAREIEDMFLSRFSALVSEMNHRNKKDARV